ncbi:26S proteasome complex subunit SEM1 [Coemansia sp. RSA 2703]|nr:26S proteasome complex subunit SEM1 [Coemansia sp. RSA 2703]KAJ2361788.1 26S proteasome complex subunit SEM1 [Coemansia sp. RSA 2607]KAJ2397380.1 26S proteasome complex subunit SEM1 [Coemansia sp. RSA 2603]
MSDNQTANNASSEQTTKNNVNLIEDDDEFEEFVAEDWDESSVDVDELTNVFQGWEDDSVEDDFSKQLRVELEKSVQTSIATSS